MENCEIPSAAPKLRACHLCLPGFFLDHSSNRCSLIPKKYFVPNCLRYHWEYSCLECQRGFFLKKKRCYALKNPIEHCKKYIDPKICLECDDGYFFDFNLKKSQKISPKTKLHDLLVSKMRKMFQWSFSS